MAGWADGRVECARSEHSFVDTDEEISEDHYASGAAQPWVEETEGGSLFEMGGLAGDMTPADAVRSPEEDLGAPSASALETRVRSLLLRGVNKGSARDLPLIVVAFLVSCALSFPVAFLDQTVNLPGGITPSRIGVILTLLAAIVCLRWEMRNRSDAHYLSLRCSRLVQIARKIIEQGDSPDVLASVMRSAVDVLALKNAELEIRIGSGRVSRAVAVPNRRGSRIYPIDVAYRDKSYGRFIAYVDEDTVPTSTDQMLFEWFARELAASVYYLRHGTFQRGAAARVRNDVQHRIQRDLHDGLGPILAAVKMQVDSARALLPTDLNAADTLLQQVGTETQNAVADVRRLVGELRTPAMHSTGLTAALSEQVTRFERATAGRLRVRMETPPQLPELPDPVAVAVFRIASEALTNVAKHAQARNCVIRLEVDDDLRLEIVDDGVGICAKSRTGIGLVSMRARAQELGGECGITRRGVGGTRVAVRLPLDHL
jgi:signal transduction histidine kinase